MGKIFILLLLLGIFVFHLINNIIILKADTSAVGYQAYILGQSAKFYQQIIEGKISFKDLYDTYANYLGSNTMPPLLIISPVLVYPFLGISRDSTVLTNMLFFLILLFSTYNIGRIMYDKKAGLLAAFVVSLFPGTFGFSRLWWYDFALMSMVSLTLYLYLATDNFKNLRNSVLFGICTGLGHLTKVSYILFLLVPLIHFFGFRCFKQELSSSRKKILINLAISLIIGILIASTYYLPNLSTILERARVLSFQEVFRVRDKNIFEGLRDWLLLKPTFFISIAAFLTYLRRKGLFLPLAIIIPLFIFSLTPNVNPRYILPVLPAIAVILSAEVFALGKCKTVASLLLISFLIIQFFVVCYVPDEKLLFMKNDITELRAVGREHTGLMTASKQKNAGPEKLIEILTSNSQKIKDRNINILFAFHDLMILAGDLYYQGVVKRLGFNVITPYCTEYYYFKKNQQMYRNFEQLFRDSDFVISKAGGDIGSFVYDDFDIIKNLARAFDDQKENFTVCGKIPLSDNSELLVYRNKAKFE